ncbi:MAG: hypothetical protein GXX85_16350 [Ignavibacteria bacterium]|nr:hypothetical protein [Ignavibacteria bacterium]
MIVNYIFAFFFICMLFSMVLLIFFYSKQPKRKSRIPYKLDKTLANNRQGQRDSYFSENSINDAATDDKTSNTFKSNKSPKVMRVVVKIILTIVAIIIATFLIGALKSATGSESTDVLGLVIGAGLLGGIIAIWKYNSKPDENNQVDKHQLDKS